MMDTQQSILDILDELTPAKGKNRYHCPSCDGGAFTVDPRSGKYQCWHGCDTKEIWALLFPKKGQAYDYEKIAERRREREENDRLERERLLNSLTPVERDREIRKILDSLGLNESDRQYLLDRGLPDWRINQCRSLPKQWVKINGDIDQKLAGIDSHSRLTNFSKGIYVPIVNADGYFVGHKYRNLDDGAKYPWLSGPNYTGKTNKLNYGKDGQNPIGVSYPSEYKHRDRIGIVEGPEFKGPIACERLGYPVIAISGNQFLSYSEQILEAIPLIQSHAELNPDLIIVTIPDSGMIGKNQGVEANYRKFAALISNSPYTSEIAVWDGQDVKGNDVDEITNLEAITYKTPLDVFGEFDSDTFYYPQEYGFTFPDTENWVDPRDPSGPEYEAYEQYLEQEDFTDEAVTQCAEGIAQEKKQNGFQRWLDKLLKPKGKRAKRADFAPIPPKPVQTFANGEDRAPLINELISQGERLIHDQSFMGLGKTHAVPDLVNPDGKIYYVSKDHRNPTVEGIKTDFTDLIPRTKYGFKRDDNGRLVKAGPDTPDYELAIKPNCQRAPMFEGVYASGHQVFNGEDINPVCGTCPALKVCRAKNFLNDRARRMKNSKIRTAIEGLDRFADYSKDIPVIDELGSLSPTKQIISYHSQRLNELDGLRDVLNSDPFQYLDSLTQALKTLSKGKQGKYGLDTEAILKSLPTHPYLSEIIEFLETSPIDLAQYFLEPDAVKTSDKRFKGVARLANKIFNSEAAKETYERLAEMPPNNLVYLLKMLRGDTDVRARLNGDRLTLTIEERFYAPILSQAKAVVLLDASATAQRIKLVTGLEDFKTIKQATEKPFANVKINIIETEGLGHNNPSDKALERVRHLLTTLKPDATLGFKKHLETLDLDGYWFKDNIGSNAYKGMKNLVFVGTPAPNIGQVRDEYLVLGGDPEGFPQYYDDLIKEQVLQACGRQRAHLDRDLEFTINWICTDADLDWLADYGATITKTTAYEINPLAGTETQILKLSCLEAIAKLIEEGKKVSFAAIGETLRQAKAKIGTSKSTIWENCKRWGVSLPELIHQVKTFGLPIEELNSSPERFSEPNFRQFMGLDVIVDVAETIAAVASMSWEAVKDLILDFRDKTIQLEALRLIIEAMGLSADKPHPNTS